MPYFPDKGDVIPSDIETAHKRAFTHNSSDEYLVLAKKNPEKSWLELISGQENWTEEEKKAFVFSQFYLRRLLNVVSPHSFPQVAYIDDQNIVVKKIEGKLLAWKQLTEAEQVFFSNQLEVIGIEKSNFDLLGKNFIRQEKNNVLTGNIFYIDDIGDLTFFSSLGSERSNLSFELEFEYSSDSEVSWYYKNQIDEQKFMSFITNQENNLTQSQRAQAIKILKRFQFHADMFPVLKLIEVNKLLKK